VSEQAGSAGPAEWVRRRTRSMSLGVRLTLVSAVAVAVAVALASTAAFLIVRHQLVDQIDQSLIEQLAAGVRVQQAGPGFTIVPAAPGPFSTSGYVQVATPAGQALLPEDETVRLPITSETLEVARGTVNSYFSDATVRGVHLRILTASARGPQGPLAVQIARRLTDVDASLRSLKWILFFLTLAGTALAALAGLAVAQTGLAPVRRLTDTVERVIATGDLSERIDVQGDDELGRLAGRFNAMLDSLQALQAAQRQLVADASHELRTPLTSLRTNLELLARGDDVPPEEREQMIGDVVAELEDLSVLVSDLTELARGAAVNETLEYVSLDEVVAHALDRSRRRNHTMTFRADLERSMVHGVPARIDRAVGNLLDNAVKWSPPEGPVEITVRDGSVTVRDHGPGIPPDDLPFVFDRFYRSAAGRSMPGSGLGLAIVRQVAEIHGGFVTARNAEDGGAILCLHLPPADLTVPPPQVEADAGSS
jgi:two-component system sensor histidine kinase MprB